MVEKKLNLVINFIELKYRIFYSLCSFVITFIVCFEYKIELFYIIAKSFLEMQEQFIYTGLFDPLLVYFKLSLFSSFILTFPFLFYFIAFFFFKSLPTVYIVRYIWLVLSFYFSILLIYYLFFQLILVYFFEFLTAFQRNKIFSIFELHLEATIVQYYSLYTSILTVYFLCTLIPLLFLFLVIMNIITEEVFMEFTYRKYLYIGLIFFVLLISPPDVTIQIFIFPLLVLIIEFYLFLITFSYLIYKLK